MAGRSLTASSKLAALAFGLAAGFLLCEFALRILRPAVLEPGLEDVEPFVMPDAALGWRGRPNLVTEARFDPDFRHAVRTNARGLRGGETTLARDGRKRILCLGDSFTWGLGVEGAEAFPSLLGKGLPDTDVVNAGVIGWGTAQEWLWLQAEGFAYTPDTLVLGFHVNDFWDNAARSQPLRRPLFAVRGGELVLVRPPSAALAKVEDPGFVGAPERTRAESVVRFLRLHSRVARLALLGVEWLRVFFAPVDRTSLERADLGRKPAPDVPPAEEVTAALLGRIRDACAARGIRLVVLVIPAHEDVRPELEGTARAREWRQAYDAAVRACARLGLDAVGLREKLAEMERAGAGGFHRTDIHLNPAGHRAAADLLLARLAAR